MQAALCRWLKKGCSYPSTSLREGWSSLGSATRTPARIPQGTRKFRQEVHRGHPCIQSQLRSSHWGSVGSAEPQPSYSRYNLTPSRTLIVYGHYSFSGRSIFNFRMSFLKSPERKLEESARFGICSFAFSISCIEIPFPRNPCFINKSFNNHTLCIQVDENIGYSWTKPVKIFCSLTATKITDSF